MGTRAPTWRRFTPNELRLSRSIDTARTQLEAAQDADDQRLVAVWRQSLAELEGLIPEPPSATDPSPPEAA